MKSNNAILYCATWSDEVNVSPVELQAIELHTYCLLQGLEVVDVVYDDNTAAQAGKEMRPGLKRVLDQVVSHNIGHIVVLDIARICKNSRQAVALLTEAFDSDFAEIHVVAWNLSTGDAQGKRLLQVLKDMYSLDKVTKASNTKALNPHSVIDTLKQGNEIEKYKAHQLLERKRNLYKEVFALLQDENFAGPLLSALFVAKDSVVLSLQEQEAVHEGYDHALMFRAAGFRIKAEATTNTRLVAGVIARHWEVLRDSVREVLGEELSHSYLGKYF